MLGIFVSESKTIGSLYNTYSNISNNNLLLEVKMFIALLNSSFTFNPNNGL